MTQPTQVRNPRRLLILAPAAHSPSTIPPFLHSLTGVPVGTASGATFAGYTTHPPLRLKTKYYTADVPIWVDEIPLDTAPSSSSPSASPPSTTTPTTDPAAKVTPSTWQTEFSSPEAQVVRDAIGAVILCVRNLEPPPPLPSGVEGEGPAGPEDVHARADVRALKDFLRAVGAVRAVIEDERGGVEDVPAVVVLVGPPQTPTASSSSSSARREDDGLDLDGDEDADDVDRPFSVAWWEDQLFEMGLVGVEVVGWDPRGGEGETRNRFGEYQGMRRVREVLETHQWAATDPDTEIGDDDDELERQLLGLDEDSGFDWEVGELEREMVGLRFAMERGESEGEGEGVDQGEGEGDERRVESVEALLLRMQAIRDMSDELPEQERKRFAARAVRDIMKEL